MTRPAARALSVEEAEMAHAIRLHCQELGEYEETLGYGNPTFKRGRKPFAVLDRYKGSSCLWVRVDPVLRDDQIAVDGWFASPYDPRQTALCCVLEKLDKAALGPLIKASYHLAAA